MFAIIFFICRPPRRWPDMFAASCCLITVTRPGPMRSSA
jgi:hypothetical protein